MANKNNKPETTEEEPKEGEAAVEEKAKELAETGK